MLGYNNLVEMFICCVCTVVNICELDPEVGHCEDEVLQYFYNVTAKKCEKFYYGGCGGNRNRFQTMHQCQTTCG